MKEELDRALAEKDQERESRLQQEKMKKKMEQERLEKEFQARITKEHQELVKETEEKAGKPLTMTITKDGLIQQIGGEYNILLGKLRTYHFSPEEMEQAKKQLEGSFLWFRAAVEKLQV